MSDDCNTVAELSSNYAKSQDNMRAGVIERFDADGALDRVIVRVDGDLEGPYPIVEPWGVRVDLSTGQAVIIVQLDGPTAEYAVIPATWRRSSGSSDFVALKQDVDSLNTRVDDLELNVSIHIHNVPIPSPMAPTPTTTPFVPPPIVAPPAVDPFPTTSADIVASDRLKATHG